MSGTNSLACSAGVSGATLGGYFGPLAGTIADGIATEANYQVTLQNASTFSELTAYCLAVAAGTTFNFRSGGSNGFQTITQGVGSGYTTDSTHSDSASAGTKVDLAWGSNSGLTETLYSITMTQNAATPTVAYQTGQAGQTLSTSTQYCPVMGALGTPTTTEDINTQNYLYAPGVLNAMGVNLSASSSGTTTVNARVNSANGNQTITISSGVTAFSQDTTHTDNVVVGNLYDTAYVSTNASGTISNIYYNFSGTTSAHNMITGCSTSFDTTYFNFAGNSCLNVISSETGAANIANYSLTASKLTLWVKPTSTVTITSRHNLSGGNMSASLVAQTGPVSDATHTDSISAGDKYGGQTSTTNLPSYALINGDDGSSDTITGAGAIALNIAVASVGTSITPGSGALGLNIAVAGTGLAIKDTAGAVGLNIAVAGAATGIEQAALTVTMNLDVLGVPKYTFPTGAAIGLNIAVAPVGTNAAISSGGGDVPPPGKGHHKHHKHHRPPPSPPPPPPPPSKPPPAPPPEIPFDVKDWKRKYGRWKELEEEAIAAEMERRQKIRDGVVDAFERSVEGKKDPEPPPPPVPLPPLPHVRTKEELAPLIHQLSIRKHSPSNHQELDDEEALLLL